MKKLSKLLLSSFLMLSCFNISSVYAEGEETGDVPSEVQTDDSTASNSGTSDNGTVETSDGFTEGTDSLANESDISLTSDGPGEFEGVATITRDGVLNYFSTVADAVAYAIDGEIITLTTDVSEFVTIEGKSITLDLGEHTISGLEGQEGTVITIKNATATVTNGTVTGGTKCGLIFEDSTIILSKLSVNNNKGGFQNHTIGNSGGGGLFALNSDVTIRNSVFSNNTANTSQTEDGGAISFWGAKALTISDCTFTNNTANGGGGAVFLKKGSKLYLSGSNFTSNTAQTAGAIQFGDKTVGVNIEKCVFSENKASGTAGALYVSTTADINVTNCTFDHNNAGTTAGAISVYGGKATIAGTTIKNNESATYGGAIYALVGTVNIKDSSDISSNKSTYGGAIFAQTIKELTIVDSSISKNEAYYGGGLMPYQSEVKLQNSDVYENNATVAGGGFYVWNASSLTSTNSSIINNIANNFGGGIYSASNNNKISISSDTELVNNTVPKANYGGSDYCGFGELTISKVNPELVLSETKHKIDGWYYDGYFVDDETSENNRWSLDDDDEYVREFDLGDEDTITYKGSELLALRAAHAHYRGYTVKYLDADSGEAIVDELSFEDIKVGKTVKATAIDVDGYEFTNAVVGSATEVSSKDAELVIDKDEEKNVITFLYKALRNYTVNYVDEDTNTPISDRRQ